MTERTKRILTEIAKKNGVTADEIERDIRTAIQTAMVSNDPSTQAIWKQISPDGSEPSIDVLMDYIIGRIIAGT